MALPSYPCVDVFSIKLSDGLLLDECCLQRQEPHITVGAIGRLFGLPNPESDVFELLQNMPHVDAWGIDVHLKFSKEKIRHCARVYPPLALLVLACELGAAQSLRYALSVWVKNTTDTHAENNRRGGYGGY